MAKNFDELKDIIAQECERMIQKEYGMSVAEFNEHPNPIPLWVKDAEDMIENIPAGTKITFKYEPNRLTPFKSDYTGPERRKWQRGMQISTHIPVIE